ncbi:MAG: BrnA antitoxin family protein [Rhodoferax sp.]|nr:BrnA antitoxin family protein [Rhodoferax sp.]
MRLEDLDIEAEARAIEADAEQNLPGLRESLGQLQRGEYAAMHTPERILERRKAGRPVGTVKEDAKVQTAIRFDADVLAAAKASGPGWQTRINELVRREFIGA